MRILGGLGFLGLLAVAGVATGCVSSGKQWASESPTDPSDQRAEQSLARESRDLPEDDGAPIPVRRKTIRLGEIYVADGHGGELADTSNHLPSQFFYSPNGTASGYGYGYGYGGYYGAYYGGGYGHYLNYAPSVPGWSPSGPSGHGGGSSPGIGGNFPAAPSYGPPMMSHTSPGNAWK